MHNAWRGLAHVEINLIRNSVLRPKHLSCAEMSDLLKLIRGRRQSAHFVIGRTEIVKRSIGITENFQMQRRFADLLAIGHNLNTGR